MSQQERTNKIGTEQYVHGLQELALDGIIKEFEREQTVVKAWKTAGFLLFQHGKPDPEEPGIRRTPAINIGSPDVRTLLILEGTYLSPDLENPNDTEQSTLSKLTAYVIIDSFDLGDDSEQIIFSLDRAFESDTVEDDIIDASFDDLEGARRAFKIVTMAYDEFSGQGLNRIIR